MSGVKRTPQETAELVKRAKRLLDVLDREIKVSDDVLAAAAALRVMVEPEKSDRGV